MEGDMVTIQTVRMSGNALATGCIQKVYVSGNALAGRLHELVFVSVNALAVGFRIG